MIGALLEALRPKQWTKNLLLFAGVLFSQQLGDPQLVLRAAAGFVAFSLLSGAVYLFNDLRDVEADRLHPTKRQRPIASGRLPVGGRVGGAGAAARDRGRAVAVARARRSRSVAAVYLVLNLAYTLRAQARRCWSTCS